MAGTAKGDLGLAAVLVRPDGVVAWAGEPGFDRDSFAQVVSRWF
ncbi:hypothetical protein [Kutzneria sp. NPDC052558]